MTEQVKEAFAPAVDLTVTDKLRMLLDITKKNQPFARPHGGAEPRDGHARLADSLRRGRDLRASVWRRRPSCAVSNLPCHTVVMQPSGPPLGRRGPGLSVPLARYYAFSAITV